MFTALWIVNTIPVQIAAGSGPPPLDGVVPPLDDGPARKPYQRLARQLLQPRRRCLAPACCVGQDRRRGRVVPELEVRPARVDHRPLGPRESDAVALGRVKGT